MALERVLQGTDVTRRDFTIKDSTGVTVNIADINDYHIYVYSLTNGLKKNLLTFKKTPVASTDKQIIVVNTTTIGFIVDRNYTKTAKPGKLYAEIEIQMTATSDYVSSLQNSGADAYEICEIIQSANPTELI